MSKALLDTDIFSEVLKDKNTVVRTRATDYQKLYGRYTISALTVTEIVAGFSKPNYTKELSVFRAGLEAVEILSLNQAAADIAGQITGALANIGQTIGTMDPLIAAVALSNNLVLVTGNTNHFERVQSLGFDLQLDNWRVALPYTS